MENEELSHYSEVVELRQLLINVLVVRLMILLICDNWQGIGIILLVILMLPLEAHSPLPLLPLEARY